MYRIGILLIVLNGCVIRPEPLVIDLPVSDPSTAPVVISPTAQTTQVKGHSRNEVTIAVQIPTPSPLPPPIQASSKPLEGATPILFSTPWPHPSSISLPSVFSSPLPEALSPLSIYTPLPLVSPTPLPSLPPPRDQLYVINPTAIDKKMSPATGLVLETQFSFTYVPGQQVFLQGGTVVDRCCIGIRYGLVTIWANQQMIFNIKNRFFTDSASLLPYIQPGENTLAVKITYSNALIQLTPISLQVVTPPELLDPEHLVPEETQ